MSQQEPTPVEKLELWDRARRQVERCEEQLADLRRQIQNWNRELTAAQNEELAAWKAVEMLRGEAKR